jgi:epoxyqueuosine reductase
MIASLAAEAERLLDDASPLVRGAAVWALSQLVVRERFEALARRRGAKRMKRAREWRSHHCQTLILRSASARLEG